MRAFFGDEPFLLVNGDMVFDFDLRGLVRPPPSGAARGRRWPCARTPTRAATGRSCTATDGRVRSLAGLPRPTRGHGRRCSPASTCSTPRCSTACPPGPSDTVRDLYAPLVAEGEPSLGVRVRGAWYDLGSPSLYLASQRALLAAGFGGAKRGVLVHPEAAVASRRAA